MDNLICKKCGEIINDDKLERQKILLKQGGFHLKASCPSCKTFIKFLPHEKDPKLYFGKYKGCCISHVAKIDPGYLRWLLSEDLKSKKLVKDIREALCSNTK